MWRRYTHFDWLHKRLCEKFSMIIIPPLPDRGGRTAAGGGSSDLSHHLFVLWAIKWYMPDLWCVYVGVLVHCPSIAFYLLAFVLGLSDQHPNNILRWIRFEFSARVGISPIWWKRYKETRGNCELDIYWLSWISVYSSNIFILTKEPHQEADTSKLNNIYYTDNKKHIS